MKRILRLILIVMLALCACDTQPQVNDATTTPTETEAPTMPEPTIHPDRKGCSVPKGATEALLTYKVIGARELKLYFLPPTTQVYEKAPIIFMFPGGGLMACDMFSPYAIYHTELPDLRAAGFATVTIDYRIGGAGGEGVTPHEIVSDCMDAMRYISYYSDVLGVDPQNIVTTGHSAGGMLSLLIGYAPHELFDADSYWFEADFNVVGAFPLSPNTNFCKGDGPYDGYYSKTSPDTSLWSTQELRELCSVIRYIGNGGIPCKILIGTADEWVSSIGVEQFKEACDAGGVDCEVIWFEGVNHGFCYEDGAQHPRYNAERAKILQFAQACVN